MKTLSVSIKMMTQEKKFIGVICPIKTDLVVFKKLWLQHFDYSGM